MRVGVQYRLALVGLAGIILASLSTVLASSLTVSPSNLFDAAVQNPITADDLAPPECQNMNLVSIVTGSGSFNGDKDNNLILGSEQADTIQGKGGDDCIVGGGGDDDLDGKKDNDVLLGGPGDDILNGDKDTDVCIGGPGTNQFIDCETQS